MEKIWTADVKEQNPNKWIVMTNMEWSETGNNMKIGFVHSIVDTDDEAYLLCDNLSEKYGNIAVIKGRTDTMYVGGLCSNG